LPKWVNRVTFELQIGNASVAQLVEQKTLNLFVEGSNPSGGTNSFPKAMLGAVGLKSFEMALQLTHLYMGLCLQIAEQFQLAASGLY